MVKALTLRWRRLQLRLTALMAVVVVACGSGTTAIDPSSLAGDWGGQNILMTVTDAGAHVDMPCAQGDISGPIAQSPFSVAGTFATTAGPSFIEHPALYTGTVVGDTMTLDIRLTDTNDSAGSFTLTRGAVVHFPKCV